MLITTNTTPTPLLTKGPKMRRKKTMIHIDKDDVLNYVANPCEATAKPIIPKILNLVEAWLKTHQYKYQIFAHEDLADWVQDMTMEVIKSLKNYKPTDTAEFTTYATKVIQCRVIDKNLYQHSPKRKIHTVFDEYTTDIHELDDLSDQIGYTPEQLLDADADPLVILQDSEKQHAMTAFEQLMSISDSWVLPFIAGKLSARKAMKQAGVETTAQFNAQVLNHIKLFSFMTNAKYYPTTLKAIQHSTVAEAWVLPILFGQATIREIVEQTGHSQDYIKIRLQQHIGIIAETCNPSIDKLNATTNTLITLGTEYRCQTPELKN